jgi:hypothetical protein
MTRIIDTFDILLIGWLCFYFFKDIKIFPWWIFFILFLVQIIFEGLGKGIVNAVNKKKEAKK